MPRAHLVRTCRVVETPRVLQMRGMFDVQPSPESREEWAVDLPLDERPWSIGLIVGPSGCGKSTIAREMFGDAVITGHDWPLDRSVLDGFPEACGIKEITAALSSVGFASPPSWLRPYHVLSTGQQFRVTVARALAEAREIVVIDEFTSVVDRTVAQIGSAAVAKAVRRAGKRFVAVTCHYDVLDWLQPDWTYEPATNTYAWRAVQRRPPLHLTIRRVHRSAWRIFKKHHYLTGEIMAAAVCFCAFLGDEPVAFIAYRSQPGRTSGWAVHRTVTLPDYQGVGIALALSDATAARLAGTGRPVYGVTANPPYIRTLAASKTWRMIRAPRRRGYGATHYGDRWAGAYDRATASFRYVGPAEPGGID